MLQQAGFVKCLSTDRSRRGVKEVFDYLNTEGTFLLQLLFGVASTPAVLQKAMDQVLLRIQYTNCYLDDILISGPDEKTHLRTLGVVLGLLGEYGLHVRQDKCLFFQESVEYLGHIIDAAGLHKSPETPS